jgi:hypothetical protein
MITTLDIFAFFFRSVDGIVQQRVFSQDGWIWQELPADPYHYTDNISPYHTPEFSRSDIESLSTLMSSSISLDL